MLIWKIDASDIQVSMEATPSFSILCIVLMFKSDNSARCCCVQPLSVLNSFIKFLSNNMINLRNKLLDSTQKNLPIKARAIGIATFLGPFVLGSHK